LQADRRRSSRPGCSRHFHSAFPIGIYAVVCAVISICSALLLPDQTNKDISHEVHYGNA